MKKFFDKVVTEITMMYKVHLRATGLLFFVPLIYTLIFGGLFYQNTVTKVPVLICNLDDGNRSQKLIEDLYNTPEIEVVGVEYTAADMNKLFTKEQVSGIVVIPKDYSKKVNSGGNAVVELMVNLKNTVLGGTVVKGVQSVISNNNATVMVSRGLAAGMNMSQVQSAQLTMSSRVLYNPTGGYIDFFLAALILHAGQIATVFVIGPSFSLEKKYRLEELKDNPYMCLIVKLLVYGIYEVTVMATCIAISIGGFKMVCRGDFFDILLIITAFTMCMMAFAIFVGAWVNVAYKTITLSLFYIMPSILFTGAIWPRTSMDSFSLFLSYVMPIGYAANDLRNLLVKGMAADLQFHIEMLLVFGLIFFILAIVGVKRNVRDNEARMEITNN